jgi:hypothetical protein
MNAILADYTEKIMDVFMYDFSVYGTSFDNYTKINIYDIKEILLESS